jgi:hypothetical protein
MITQLDQLDQFVDRLLEEKGIKQEVTDTEVVQQLHNDLKDRVEDRVNVVIIEHLPENKLEEFNTLLDQDNEDAIQTFCQAHISNLDELLAGELLAFRSTYLNL